MLASENVLYRISINSVEWIKLNNRFMYLWKLGIIVDQYSCKTALYDFIWLKYSISNFNSFSKRFMKLFNVYAVAFSLVTNVSCSLLRALHQRVLLARSNISVHTYGQHSVNSHIQTSHHRESFTTSSLYCHCVGYWNSRSYEGNTWIN